MRKNLIPEYLFFQLKAKYSDIRGLVGENREGLSINLLKELIYLYLLLMSKNLSWNFLFTKLIR
jgi:hypothetical protein